MLLTTDLTVAYKCSCCGAFDFSSISIFKLTSGKSFKNYCRHCRKSSISVTALNKYYRIETPCISCGGRHELLFEKRKILNKDPSVFTCPQTGLQICFIGRDHEVRVKVDRLENELDELISMFGYDNYFKNTRVMFDTLNIIHDIAERENLYCECGSRNIELVLLPDLIQLKCKDCFRLETLKAATNEDLKRITEIRKICLTGKFPQGLFPRNSSKELLK